MLCLALLALMILLVAGLSGWVLAMIDDKRLANGKKPFIRFL